MITNSDGWIALKFLQTIPHTVTVRGNTYAFVVKRNVNLTWVRPEDLESMLAIRRECCGGQKHPKYVYANEQDVYWWTQ